MMPLAACLMLGIAACLPAGAPVTAVAFAPDGTRVVAGSQEGLSVYSWPGLLLLSKRTTDLSHINRLAFSPAGTALLAGGGSPAEKGLVETLSWPGLTSQLSVTVSRDLVYGLAWSADGKHWAAGSADGTCMVHAANNGKRIRLYEGHSRPVLSLAYTTDGEKIISASVDQTLQVWDPATGKLWRTLDNHVNSVNCVATRLARKNADDMPLVASCSEDGTVRLWQPGLGRLVRFTRLASIPRLVVWSPVADELVVGCNDGTVLWLQAETLETRRRHAAAIGRIHCLATHPTGRVVVGGEKGLAAAAP